ncbi:uncharacterized protein LOC142346049 [Convolutriloba macropyga]|uniref:uncharacterized protein LOC142346049 n=1 Tax=Convolutriloba macropyga TaxID=536237 RepID=UPI003F526DA6
MEVPKAKQNCSPSSRHDSLIESGGSSAFGEYSAELVCPTTANHIQRFQVGENSNFGHAPEMNFNRHTSGSTLSNCYMPQLERLAISSANLDSGISVGSTTGSNVAPSPNSRWKAGLRKCTNCDDEFDFSGFASHTLVGEVNCLWCVECEGFIIDTCIVAHLINKVTKFHTFVDQSNARCYPKLCQTHRDLVRYYCVDCSEECCTNCMLGHCGHLYRGINEQRGELVRVAEGVNNVRLERERQLQVRADELEYFKENCLHFQKEAKPKIIAKFQQLRNILDNHERQMLQRIDNLTSVCDRVQVQIEASQINSQSLRYEIERLHNHPNMVTCQELLTKNARLLTAETDVLSAVEYELPKLVEMTSWKNDSNEASKLFEQAVESAGYKLFMPSIRSEFEMDISTIAEESDDQSEPRVVPPNQVAQTEHFRKATLASLVVRDIAYDVEGQRLFVAFKNAKSILQFSLQGHHQANIEVHSVPWRLEFRHNVLYFSVQSLEGVYALTVLGESPQVEKVCHLKTCAFSLTLFQPSPLASNQQQQQQQQQQPTATQQTTNEDPNAREVANQMALSAGVLLIARVSKPELCLYDCVSNQIMNRTAHGLQQVHYVTQDPRSGIVAISNANEAVVLIFTPQLYLLTKLDSQTHSLKWPIGLTFNTHHQLADNPSTDQKAENSLYICDSDSHKIMAYDLSANQVVATHGSLQGAAFVKFVTPKLFLTASVLNLKIKFVRTDDQV